MRLTPKTIRRLGYLPPGLLVFVATLQIGLVSMAGLSPWLGGGFGMFSTLNDRGHRHLHLTLERSGVQHGVDVPAELHDRARRVLALPTEARLRALAAAVASHSNPSPGSELRLAIWRTRYDPESLQPSSHVLRKVTIRIGEPGTP